MSRRASELITCTPRFLPASDWARSIENAFAVNPANLPENLELDKLPDRRPGERAALDIGRYWGPGGVRLTVGFIDTRDTVLREMILAHLNAWSRCANVSFVASETDPRVRIARWTAEDSRGDEGYWSNLGTDILLIPKDRPTMNLEAFTAMTPETEFRRVVRHEAGHTLGFPHEHMRARIIRRLDRAKVIAEFQRTQGWTEDEVIAQILTPLEDSAIIATPTADETSIMCYQIDGSLTVDGEAIEGGIDINESDHKFSASCYPKKLD